MAGGQPNGEEEVGSVASVSASAAAAALPATSDAQQPQLPNDTLRVYDGDRRPGADREWHNTVAAVRVLCKADLAQLAVLVDLALDPGEGKPRSLVDHLD